MIENDYGILPYRYLTALLGLFFVAIAFYEAWKYFQGNRNALGPVWLRILARMVVPLVIAILLIVVAAWPSTLVSVGKLLGIWELAAEEEFQRQSLIISWIGIWTLNLAVIYLLYQVSVIRRILQHEEDIN